MLEFAFHHVLVSQSKPLSRFLLAVHRPGHVDFWNEGFEAV